MIRHVEIISRERPRGFHLVARKISEQLPYLPQRGSLNPFVRHTCRALSFVKEDFNPDTRTGMTEIYVLPVKGNEPYYDHVPESADDMPVRAERTPTDICFNMPISKGNLYLDTGQGIYFVSSATTAENACSRPSSSGE